MTAPDDFQRKARRRAARQRDLDVLRDGRRDRAVRFEDPRKRESREACRGRVDWRAELDEWEG